MKHYICPVCGGAADHPKTCETEGCARKGQPLEECDCTDGQHEGRVQTPSPETK